MFLEEQSCRKWDSVHKRAQSVDRKLNSCSLETGTFYEQKYVCVFLYEDEDIGDRIELMTAICTNGYSRRNSRLATLPIEQV